MDYWFLEGPISGDVAPRRVVLEQFPVLVGRQPGLALADVSDRLSRYHAELIERGEALILRDLGSQHGTCVNGRRLEGETVLARGDTVAFADARFQVGLAEAEHGPGAVVAPALAKPGGLGPTGPGSPVWLDDLFATEAIDTVYQPIVALSDGGPVGFECLTRGAHPRAPASPGQLLAEAARAGRAIELAELMRRRSVDGAATAGLEGALFVNIHPAEVEAPQRLVEQLASMAQRWPRMHLVLEIHEGAVTDLAALQRLHRHLHANGVGLAYDDFGAGRARLRELGALPPDYLKFDAHLIRNLASAPASQYRLVETLVDFARETGVTTLAEGIRDAAQARACRELGFDWAQGYYFGAPEAAP